MLAHKTTTVPNVTTSNHNKPLRVGFVPLTDCAPLVMAQELGLFARHGLKVELSRELGWATVRDKIIYGELDAAHALAAMPFATSLGLGSIKCDCLTGLVLSLHGNAITLSKELWERGVRDAKTLRDEIIRARGKKTYTFGVVFQYSSHNFLLRQWLTSGGINPDKDVRIVVVPPPQMYVNLKTGNLDGYCVGEPWNSVAVQHRIGWCPVTSAQLAPGHPEKVLMVRKLFAEQRAAEHIALIAALLEACAFCDRPENSLQISQTLASARYVNTTAEALSHSMFGKFDYGHGRVENLPDFTIFHQNEANEPTQAKAAWVLGHLLNSGLAPDPAAVRSPNLKQTFANDVFHQAQQLLTTKIAHENASISVL
jgi:ABC-type nitrate/sulfonate/bicarbonate transport system substrate-binding protein